MVVKNYTTKKVWLIFFSRKVPFFSNKFSGRGLLFEAMKQGSSLKVRKFQNEYMKSSHCPKYEQKN